MNFRNVCRRVVRDCEKSFQRISRFYEMGGKTVRSQKGELLREQVAVKYMLKGRVI